MDFKEYEGPLAWEIIVKENTQNKTNLEPYLSGFFNTLVLPYIAPLILLAYRNVKNDKSIPLEEKVAEEDITDLKNGVYLGLVSLLFQAGIFYESSNSVKSDWLTYLVSTNVITAIYTICQINKK